MAAKTAKSDKYRCLEPLALCRCGRAAAFKMITMYNHRSPSGFITVRDRSTTVCAACADKLNPIASSHVFTSDDEVLVTRS